MSSELLKLLLGDKSPEEIAALRKASEPKLQADPDAAIMTMREIAASYRKNPYAPLEVITPRRGTAYRSAGNPHVVVEVLDPPLIAIGDDPSSTKWGALYDLRVVTLYDGILSMFTVESWAFIPWTEDLMPDE